MITARDGFQDMQFGFLAGADDYLVKPINVNELVLRINALLRRAQMVADRRQRVVHGRNSLGAGPGRGGVVKIDHVASSRNIWQ